MSVPLSGIRVLELARILAGPWAGQLLADLGADVVKVERSKTGDDTRAWGPPFVEGADGSNLATFSQIARVPAGKFCPGLSLWILLKPRRQWRRHWQDGFVDALANIAGRGSLGAMRQHYTPILQAETASASFT